MQLYELNLTRGIFQVPVIALFTKYEQFKRDIKMKLEDENEDDHPLAETDIGTEVKRVFEQQYLAGLCGPPPFICLESEYFFYQQIYILIISVPQGCTRMANNVLILLT